MRGASRRRLAPAIELHWRRRIVDSFWVANPRRWLAATGRHRPVAEGRTGRSRSDRARTWSSTRSQGGSGHTRRRRSNDRGRSELPLRQPAANDSDQPDAEVQRNSALLRTRSVGADLLAHAVGRIAVIDGVNPLAAAAAGQRAEARAHQPRVGLAARVAQARPDDLPTHGARRS